MNFQEKYAFRSSDIQTYRFKVHMGHPLTSWTSCVSSPVAISIFLPQRRDGTVASRLFGGSVQFTAPGQDHARIVSCQKICTFVGCRSRHILQRLMTYDLYVTTVEA